MGKNELEYKIGINISNDAGLDRFIEKMEKSTQRLKLLSEGSPNNANNPLHKGMENLKLKLAELNDNIKNNRKDILGKNVYTGTGVEYNKSERPKVDATQWAQMDDGISTFRDIVYILQELKGEFDIIKSGYNGQQFVELDDKRRFNDYIKQAQTRALTYDPHNLKKEDSTIEREKVSNKETALMRDYFDLINDMALLVEEREKSLKGVIAQHAEEPKEVVKKTLIIEQFFKDIFDNIVPQIEEARKELDKTNVLERSGYAQEYNVLAQTSALKTEEYIESKTKERIAAILTDEALIKAIEALTGGDFSGTKINIIKDFFKQMGYDAHQGNLNNTLSKANPSNLTEMPKAYSKSYIDDKFFEENGLRFMVHIFKALMGRSTTLDKMHGNEETQEGYRIAEKYMTPLNAGAQPQEAVNTPIQDKFNFEDDAKKLYLVTIGDNKIEEMMLNAKEVKELMDKYKKLEQSIKIEEPGIWQEELQPDLSRIHNKEFQGWQSVPQNWDPPQEEKAQPKTLREETPITDVEGKLKPLPNYGDVKLPYGDNSTSSEPKQPIAPHASFVPATAMTIGESLDTIEPIPMPAIAQNKEFIESFTGAKDARKEYADVVEKTNDTIQKSDEETKKSSKEKFTELHGKMQENIGYMQEAMGSLSTIANTLWQDQIAEAQEKLAEVNEQFNEVVEQRKESDARLQELEEQAKNARGGRAMALQSQIDAEMAKNKQLADQEKNLAKEKEKQEKEIAKKEKQIKKTELGQNILMGVANVALSVTKALPSLTRTSCPYPFY